MFSAFKLINMESAQHDYQNKLISTSFYKNKPEQSKQITLILVRIDLPYFPDSKFHLCMTHVPKILYALLCKHVIWKDITSEMEHVWDKFIFCVALVQLYTLSELFCFSPDLNPSVMPKMSPKSALNWVVTMVL